MEMKMGTACATLDWGLEEVFPFIYPSELHICYTFFFKNYRMNFTFFFSSFSTFFF